MNEIISIGFDKEGEADFAISGDIYGLSHKQMTELRAMIVVAIGTMEMTWRKHQESLSDNTAKNNL